jgi:hypothetical protein
MIPAAVTTRMPRPGLLLVVVADSDVSATVLTAATKGGERSWGGTRTPAENSRSAGPKSGRAAGIELAQRSNRDRDLGSR